MNEKMVSEFMSPYVHEQIFVMNGDATVVAYLQNSVVEIAKIMKDICQECIPVLISPWNKKQVGVIEFSKIRSFLNE